MLFKISFCQQVSATVGDIIAPEKKALNITGAEKLPLLTKVT
jgi:hypothetical protein